MSFDLTLIWVVIIGFAVFMYVLLDGFDLGLGILFPFTPTTRDRDTMTASIAPIWDGNETWLVLGGGGLFGAFPLAYAVLLPAFYLPLIVMLLGLIFRGVAFEFRLKSVNNRHWWDRAFAFGSTAATFSQGLVLGAFVQGVPVQDRAFAGDPMGWLTPFTLLTGLALVAGYALLGSTWLIMKSSGPLQAWARRITPMILLAVIVFMGIVSLWTPFVDEAIRQRWFSMPNLIYLSPVPLVTALTAWLLWSHLRRGSENAPFVLTMALFLLGFIGLAISLWPNLVPPSISIWEAAAPPISQKFLLVGTLFLLPIILAYNAWTYWVFRGKADPELGYHH